MVTMKSCNPWEWATHIRYYQEATWCKGCRPRSFLLNLTILQINMCSLQHQQVSSILYISEKEGPFRFSICHLLKSIYISEPSSNSTSLNELLCCLIVWPFGLTYPKLQRKLELKHCRVAELQALDHNLLSNIHLTWTSDWNVTMHNRNETCIEI